MSQRSRRTANSQRYISEEESEEDSDRENQKAARHKRNTQSKLVTEKGSKRSNSQALRVRASSSGASQSPPDDGRDESYEFSQNTQRTSHNKLSPEIENHLIGTVLRYLLIADHSKTVIQRTNIIKAALPDHSKYYQPIMAKVKTALAEVFGYNLVTLEGNKYILTNNLNNSGPHLQLSGGERAEYVLLFIVLAHIFMADESGCTEADLFDLLRTLQIIENDNTRHEYFGDIKYLLTEKFIKQGYLNLVTVSKSEPVIVHYRWGVRAENELEPRQVLEFMSKVFDNRPLDSWPVQFKTMQLRENGNG